MTSPAQPWIRSAVFDCTLILAPAFIAVAAAILWHTRFDSSETPAWLWLLLVVGIDVAHVYSTLFKTYFRSSEFTSRKTLFLTIPLTVLILGVLLYSTSPMLFWSILAYAAVFHFVRQQYGFLRIYSRSETMQRRLYQNIDKLMIYSCTILPVVWWHLAGDRQFSWLIKGDFWVVADPDLAAVVLISLYVIWAVWALKELWIYVATRLLNIPKILIVLGTAMSWYLGIIYFNADAVFTITNVIAHGIPYIGLVWMTERDAKQQKKQRFVEYSEEQKSRLLVPLSLMVPLIITLAWLEEGLWSGLVFKEHGVFFPGFDFLPQLHDHLILSIVIPILAVPQATHYIIDGFIWKQK